MMASMSTRNAGMAHGDALLSVLIPGLGQLNQRRFVAAAHFGIEALTLVTLMFAAPSLRGIAIVALVGITAWSVFDAYRRGPRDNDAWY